MLKDIAFPREGSLKILKIANPLQCAIAIFYTTLKCHEVMKAYDNVKFTTHLSILSKYIKFLAHNLQYEVVARIEKRLLEVEDRVKANKKEEASKVK